MKTILTYVIIIISVLCLHGQASQDFNYIDYNYIPEIRSVELKGIRNQTSNFPVVPLRTGRLYLSFDDLNDQQLDYTYRVIHCDKDWNPSNLTPDQYLEGFDYDEIDNAQFSRNTYQDYVHYELTLPNERYRWTISGNYLLVVYEGNQRNGVPVLTRRFLVTEQAVNVMVEPRRAMETSKINTHQNFNLKVDYTEFPISNPMQEVTVTMLQNGRWQTAIKDVHPALISNNQMIFNRTGALSFSGGLEFRFFDLRSLEFAGRGVHSIELLPYGTNVLLELQKSRKGKSHMTRSDLNGSFIISNNNQDRAGNLDADTHGDYARVIVALEHEKLQDDYAIYMIGAFSGWQPLPEYQLSYDPGRSAYIGESLFKQGYYDYELIAVKEGELYQDIFEGEDYDTENIYQVLVYLSDFSSRYDRLISVKSFNFNR